MSIVHNQLVSTGGFESTNLWSYKNSNWFNDVIQLFYEVKTISMTTIIANHEINSQALSVISAQKKTDDLEPMKSKIFITISNLYIIWTVDNGNRSKKITRSAIIIWAFLPVK